MYAVSRAKRIRAMGLVLELLASGPRNAAEIRTASDARGISFRTVERAAQELGVVSQRAASFQGPFIWQLPPRRRVA